MARILIIDDDKPFRVMLRIVLENAGYKDITEAENGYIGMKLIRKNPFDLVITDILMPEMDGVDVIRALRRRGSAPPILAISGGASSLHGDLLNAAIKLGAQRTLLKPFTSEAFLNMVADLLTPLA